MSAKNELSDTIKKGQDKLRKHPEIALLNHLRNHLRVRYKDDSNRQHALTIIEEIKKILVPIKQSLEQDIENPMIGMLPNLEEET